MTHDPTEALRRTLVGVINSDPEAANTFAAEKGQTWTTDQLAADFEVLGFLAPFVQADGVEGSLLFTHSPRLYYGFRAA